MNKHEALIIVKKVCADFKGTLADHQQIQSAVQLLEAIVVHPAAIEPPIAPPAP